MPLSLFRILGCMAVFGALQFNSATAQCPGGAPYSVQTYNTTRVGVSSNSYTLAQFDPTIGTLHSAELKAVVYLRYAYSLTNSGVSPENFTVNVFRDDYMYAYSPSNPTPLAVFGQTFFRQYRHDLSPTGIGQVPVGVNNYTQNVIYPRTYNQTFDQSVVPFMGSDSLYINYVTGLEVQSTINNPNVTISSGVVYDSIIFQIKYNYCPTTTLASSSLQLSSRSQSSKVVLSWTSEDRYSEGWFEILKSTDGKSYSSIHRQPVDKNQTSAYNYLYSPLATDGDKGFFRIRQTDKNGNVIYSRVVTVMLPEADNNSIAPVQQSDALIVFPTVATSSVNLSLPKGNANDEWQISIISLSGQVLQNAMIKGSGQTRIVFNNPLPNGMHIINAVNKRTNLSYKGKIIVQH